MSIYHDYEAIKDVALSYAKEHKCNYNIILRNPDSNGEFSRENGSTYEFVTDSYFNKPRDNVKLLLKTDDEIGPVEHIVSQQDKFENESILGHNQTMTRGMKSFLGPLMMAATYGMGGNTGASFNVNNVSTRTYTASKTGVKKWRVSGVLTGMATVNATTKKAAIKKGRTLLCVGPDVVLNAEQI